LPASGGGIGDFDRRIRFESFLTELDAKARALDTAEPNVRRDLSVLIDVDRPGLALSSNIPGAPPGQS